MIHAHIGRVKYIEVSPLSVFSERLQSIRTQKSLTQKQLAQQLEITERSYQRYELGEREPNINTLVQIANILDADLNFLLGLTDDPTRR
jgi:transcriptional regulator with XRE-family HTH domain